MPERLGSTNDRVSRRDFLFVAAAGGGAMLGAGLVTARAAAAPAKMSQRAMAYQQSPKGNQSCANCANFEAPNACKLVEGTIVPTGWCILYRAK